MRYRGVAITGAHTEVRAARHGLPEKVASGELRRSLRFRQLASTYYFGELTESKGTHEQSNIWVHVHYSG